MRVCVVGLGKIGLPLACQYAGKGFTVVGCDVNSDVVDSINKGVSHIEEEPALKEKVKDLVARKLLSATTETSKAVSESDVVVVIVPLVVDDEKNIDYSIVDAATKDVAKGLRKDTLVIYETTLPVGDTRERIAPLLESGGLKAGADFYLAFSPERVSSGRIFKDLAEIPKIVGGINEESTRKAVGFYESVLDAEVIGVNDCETAEAIKLFGMAYRDVNIALANEFAKFCNEKKMDIVEAIKASNTNPHSHILLPGVGVGGHCAPVYPHFLIEKAKKKNVELTLPSRAREINDEMPEYAVGLLGEELGGLAGKRILVLGLAYRGGVKETHLSPAIDVVEKLKEEEVEVFIHDPLFDDSELQKFAEPVDLDKLPSLDGVILVTAHKEYSGIEAAKLKESGVKAFVDGRNFLDKKQFDSVGIKYRGIGRN